jgi:N-acetylglucosamine-6-phosphate deacetylase
MTVFTAKEVFINGVLVRDGWIRVDDERIIGVGTDPPPDVTSLGDARIVPGYVYIHVHGGGGFSFGAGKQAAAAAAQFHLACGTTSLIASLATAALPELSGQATRLIPLVSDGTLAGIHLEGPLLNPARKGAHNPKLLMPPDLGWLSSVIDSCGTPSGACAIKMVTLAPELPQGFPAIELVVERGVIAAIGHSDATYEQTVTTLAAGVTVGTHLFNGMPSPHHRKPGPVVALLRDPRVTVELINDGVHIHPGIVGAVCDAVGSQRIAIVTDAIDVTGMADGNYLLAGSKIVVEGGVARLEGANSLAGSTVTMDVSVKNAVRDGIAIEYAVVAAAQSPACALGLADPGELREGHRADLIALNHDLDVVKVMQEGRWTEAVVSP